MKEIEDDMKEQVRQPALYITHGAGPCFWMDFGAPFGAGAFDGLRDYFAGILPSLPARPRAILVISAHWEASVPTIGSSPAPGMFYDYDGFPPHTYELKYPAPGAPDLAMRVQDMLGQAGFSPAIDPQRGYDHGVFVPLMIIAPDADIPVLMLSLRHDLDAAAHLEIGRSLASLRDDGVLVIGSGSSFHNMRSMFSDKDGGSAAFDEWLLDTLCVQSPAERYKRLADWERAPDARTCHPRAEHLLPLMVAAGAAVEDAGTRSFHGIIGGKTYSCFTFGA